MIKIFPGIELPRLLLISLHHHATFAANLSMLYPELDFLDRFEAAAKDGFAAVGICSPMPTRRASWPRGWPPMA